MRARIEAGGEVGVSCRRDRLRVLKTDLTAPQQADAKCGLFVDRPGHNRARELWWWKHRDIGFEPSPVEGRSREQPRRRCSLLVRQQRPVEASPENRRIG